MNEAHTTEIWSACCTWHFPIHHHSIIPLSSDDPRRGCLAVFCYFNLKYRNKATNGSSNTTHIHIYISNGGGAWTKFLFSELRELDVCYCSHSVRVEVEPNQAIPFYAWRLPRSLISFHNIATSSWDCAPQCHGPHSMVMWHALALKWTNHHSLFLPFSTIHVASSHTTHLNVINTSTGIW